MYVDETHDQIARYNHNYWALSTHFWINHFYWLRTTLYMKYTNSNSHRLWPTHQLMVNLDFSIQTKRLYAQVFYIDAPTRSRNEYFHDEGLRRVSNHHCVCPESVCDHCRLGEIPRACRPVLGFCKHSRSSISVVIQNIASKLYSPVFDEIGP